MRKIRFRETSAGGIVFADERVLLLKRHDGSWVMPKGHIEPGEEPWQAALREVWEEAGVRGRILDKIGVTRYRFLSTTGRAWVEKSVHWYLMETQSTTSKPEHVFAVATFVPLTLASERLRFVNDRRILEEAVALWRKHKQMAIEEAHLA